MSQNKWRTTDKLNKSIKDQRSNQRTNLLNNLPENSCAFVTALDFINKSNWIKMLNVNEDKIQWLTKIFKNKTDASYTEAID